MQATSLFHIIKSQNVLISIEIGIYHYIIQDKN